ncbi:MAG: hypothetical protein JWO05_3860 [Gemmatimonadetes bacterium]|nr:hypothetical protein [Gemmatimonadota bacterium]
MSFSDPTPLFHSALAALNVEDWRIAAMHCDPVSLRAFQRQKVDQFAPLLPEQVLKPEDLMRLDPEMPREVAEYQAAHHRQQIDSESRLQRQLPGYSSMSQVSEADPVALFASWLEGHSPRAQVLRLVEQGQAPPEAVALMSASSTSLRFDYVVLGSVPDGEMAAHVVYRNEADEAALFSGEGAAQLAALPEDEQRLRRMVMARGHARLALCRRQEDGSWRLVAGHDFMGLASRHITSIGIGKRTSTRVRRQS